MEQRAARPGSRRKRTRLQLATARELRSAGRERSSAGLVALELAERIDAGGAETGAALAALAREHAAAMERALKQAQAADPVAVRSDEVAKRRERHRSAS